MTTTDLFKIRCLNCHRTEPDTWMGDIFPMTNKDGNTKCCDAPIGMIRRQKTSIYNKLPAAVDRRRFI